MRECSVCASRSHTCEHVCIGVDSVRVSMSVCTALCARGRACAGVHRLCVAVCAEHACTRVAVHRLCVCVGQCPQLCMGHVCVGGASSMCASRSHMWAGVLLCAGTTCTGVSVQSLCVLVCGCLHGFHVCKCTSECAWLCVQGVCVQVTGAAVHTGSVRVSRDPRVHALCAPAPHMSPCTHAGWARTGPWLWMHRCVRLSVVLPGETQNSTCVCVCVCAYMFVYPCVCTRMCVYMCLCVHTCVYTRVCHY